MPTYEQQMASQLRADDALIVIVVGTGLCCLMALRAWRVGWFATAARAALYVLLPLALLPVGWGAAALALGVNVLARLKWSTTHWPIWVICHHHVALLAVALLARLPLMNDSLWYDEAFTARMASLPLSQFPTAIVTDVHPPLYYLITWLGARIFGGSEFALRLPSLAFDLIGVLLFYRLALAAKLNRSTAFVAGLLMATLPIAIYYGTELRMYSLLTALVFGMLLAVFEYRPRLLAALGFILIWSHNAGYIYAPILACLGVWFWRWENPYARRRWLVAAAFIGIGGVLYLPIMLQQAAHVADGYWVYMSVGKLLWPYVSVVTAIPNAWLPLIFVIIAVLFFGLYRAREWIRTQHGSILMILVFGIPLLVGLVSFVWRPIFIQRHFLPLTYLLLFPVAIMLTRGRERALARAAVASIICLGCVPLYVDFNQRPDYREAYDAGCRGADALYATSIASAFISAAYWHGDMIMWDEATDLGGTFEPGALAAYGFNLGGIEEFSGRDVCLMILENPATQDVERELVADIVASAESGTYQMFYVNKIHWLHFWVVHIP